MDEEEEKGEDEDEDESDEEVAYEINQDGVLVADLNLTQVETSISEADYLYAGNDLSYDDDDDEAEAWDKR